MQILIRPIKQSDNPILSKVIKDVFREFDCAKEGTVFTDPTTDDLYEVFQAKDSLCWVAEENGNIMGCCGIYPTKGLPNKCTELVKFYLSNTSRGKGVGKALMQKCEDSAKELGYQQVYIESLPEFGRAVGMYEKLGYQPIETRLGDSGHFGCDIWMVKDL